MSQLHPKHCEDHRLTYLGLCPLCKAGVEPTRFTEAFQDFQVAPFEEVKGLKLGQPYVSLEDVVGTIGLQLAEIVRREEELLRLLQPARREIARQIRELGSDSSTFQRAARIWAGVPGADYCKETPEVKAVLDCMSEVRSQTS